jgi:hypothetical protein
MTMVNQTPPVIQDSSSPMEALITVAIVVIYNKGKEHSVGYEYLHGGPGD